MRPAHETCAEFQDRFWIGDERLALTVTDDRGSISTALFWWRKRGSIVGKMLAESDELAPGPSNPTTSPRSFLFIGHKQPD
jgi:hypothetical protein